ncbi:MAG: hypothetical protein AABY32_02965 [Nanoarchaeota archaeon]|mgnify:FL=1
MAYKKYIQKNGKLYGPYIYHSKRVDGKVVSEYRGMGGSDSNYKVFLFFFAGIVLLTGLILFFILSNRGITGNAVLGLDTFYEAGKPLNGVLKFSLKEGELIPETSKIVLENSGKTQEFVLKDVIDETPFEGNYYFYGKEVSGSGWGYGIAGEKVVHPEIEFILQIYRELSEENVIPVEVIPEENVSSEVNPEIVPNDATSEVLPNDVSPEIIPAENVEIVPTESNIETPIEIPTKTTPENPIEKNSPAPITGNSVRSSGGIFASFFGLTGRVVSMNLENEINGVVSKDKPFVYELKAGERAELKPKSVKIENEEMEDNVISLKIENGKVIVTTDYSKIVKGYGEGYVGNKEKTISLDLSDLNLILEKGDLTIKLVYGGEELVQLKTLLVEGEKTSNATLIDVPEKPILVNETPEINKTVELPVVIPKEDLNNLDKNFSEENETIEEWANSSVWEIGDFLTSSERKILLDKFGNISLQSTKSELYNGTITREYSFDKYSIKSYYNPALTRELLEINMEKDRVKFLKFIAKAASEEKN